MPVQHIQGISHLFHHLAWKILLHISYGISFLYTAPHNSQNAMKKNGWRAESEPGLELESTMSHGAKDTSKEMSCMLCHSVFHKSMLWRRERPVTPDFEKLDDR
jgi:hypothetical protein